VLFSRLIKDFDRVTKDEAGRTDPDTARMLHERKQSMVLLLNIVLIHTPSCPYSTTCTNQSLSCLADQGVELFCCSQEAVSSDLPHTTFLCIHIKLSLCV
jgi:hypothetical protein